MIYMLHIDHFAIYFAMRKHDEVIYVYGKVIYAQAYRSLVRHLSSFFMKCKWIYDQNSHRSLLQNAKLKSTHLSYRSLTLFALQLSYRINNFKEVYGFWYSIFGYLYFCSETLPYFSYRVQPNLPSKDNSLSDTTVFPIQL